METPCGLNTNPSYVAPRPSEDKEPDYHRRQPHKYVKRSVYKT